MKLKDKKHTIAQRMGRIEKVLTQLYLTNVNFGERIKKMEEILFKEEKEETDE
jgi:type II secretory pathway component PulF